MNKLELFLRRGTFNWDVPRDEVFVNLAGDLIFHLGECIFITLVELVLENMCAGIEKTIPRGISCHGGSTCCARGEHALDRRSPALAQASFDHALEAQRCPRRSLQ